jgi:hypothetical protein
VDRTPYGVIAHELGHHADWSASDDKGPYYGDYCIKVKKRSGEKPISGYADDDWEWFAEMFRLFVTNPVLLMNLRPKTYTILRERWQPVGLFDWKKELGADVPSRVITVIEKRI